MCSVYPRSFSALSFSPLFSFLSSPVHSQAQIWYISAVRLSDEHVSFPPKEFWSAAPGGCFLPSKRQLLCCYLWWSSWCRQSLNTYPSSLIPTSLCEKLPSIDFAPIFPATLSKSSISALSFSVLLFSHFLFPWAVPLATNTSFLPGYLSTMPTPDGYKALLSEQIVSSFLLLIWPVLTRVNQSWTLKASKTDSLFLARL